MSITVILDRLLRNSVMEGISLETVIDYTIDFIGISGVPQNFEQKLFKGVINEFRCELPCDYVDIIQVLFRNRHSRRFIPARYATDTFHQHYNCADVHPSHDFTYTVNRDYLFANIEHGELEMSYLAVPVDDDGFPLISADNDFLMALEWYIKYTHFTKLWEEGKLEDKRLENAKQEYAWAIARYSSHVKVPDMGQTESILNMFRTMVGTQNEFRKRFRDTGVKEIFRRHPS